jgi:hypothetical protein
LNTFEAHPYPYPLLGILKQTLGMQIFKFIGGTEKDLSRDAFLEMDYSTVCFLFLALYSDLHLILSSRQKEARGMLASSAINSQF